ncbi:MAG: type II toxin-antitoxin system VapC family toxin [Cytophagales bacterium]|nr:type II toxin-antitoxin system VapC family toxin [Cytophagales bacterium]
MKFYVDTSVWGGYYDKEFSEWTVPFITQIKEGRFTAILSNITLGELQDAPEKVRELPNEIPVDFLDFIEITKEQDELANKYIAEGALTEKSYTDAQHIAIATILKVDSLVSWNFRHMVNFFKIRQYNSINLKYGYSTIDIRTPKEITYEDNDN